MNNRWEDNMQKSSLKSNYHCREEWRETGTSGGWLKIAVHKKFSNFRAQGLLVGTRRESRCQETGQFLFESNKKQKRKKN